MPRFSSWGHHGGYGYQDWNRWRQDDGMLCRYGTVRVLGIDKMETCDRYIMVRVPGLEQMKAG